MQHHKYSLTELDNLIPWEKEIYVNMLTSYIKEENERKAKNNGYDIKISDADKGRRT